MRASRLPLRIMASRLLAMVLLLAHGAARACAVVFLPGWSMPWMVATAIAASPVFHLRRDALQWSGEAVTELILKDDARCKLTLRNGETLTGTVEGSTFVAPLLTVINVRPDGPGRRRVAILMPDSAPAQDLRRVRVWLRHRIRPDTPDSRRL